MYKRQSQDRAESFGGRVHIDTIGGEGEITESTGWRGEKFLHLIHDDATRFPYAHPAKDKTADTIIAGIKLFAGSQLSDVKKLRIDGARELKLAAQTLDIPPELSPPGRHESHGRAEAMNRIFNEGIRSMLLQSGLPLTFWPLASQHFAFNYAREPHKSLETTPFFARFNEEHLHSTVPFGSGVFYILPDRAKQPKWEPSSRKGIAIGYHQDNFKHDGSLLILDYTALTEYISADPANRSTKGLIIIRTKSWRPSPELFPIASFASKQAVVRSAF